MFNDREEREPKYNCAKQVSGRNVVRARIASGETAPARRGKWPTRRAVMYCDIASKIPSCFIWLDERKWCWLLLRLSRHGLQVA